MRKIFLSMTVALSLTSVAVQAQPHHKLSTNKQMALKQIKKQRIHDAILKQALGTGGLATAGKATTVTDQRLIGQSTYAWYDATGGGTTVWTKTDSAWHKYSNERGSKFNLNNMTFDPYYSIYSTMFMGEGVTMGMNERDYKPGILSDSSLYYSLFMADTIEPLEKVTSKYDANGNIYDYTDGYEVFSYIMRNVLTFNTDNRPLTIQYLYNSGVGTWDTSEYRTLAYNADTLTFDSTAYNNMPGWDPEYKFRYAYDAAGNATRISLWSYDPTMMTWAETERYDFEYYPSNKLQKLTISSSDGTTPMEVQEVDSIGWSTGGILTSMQNLYYSSGVPDSKYLQISHLGTSGLPDTVYTQDYYSLSATTPDYETAIAWTYNTYNNPVTASALVRTTPTSAFDSVTNTTYYYYETYTYTPVSVKDVDNSISVKLYPNPVNNQLVIMQTAGNTQIANAVVYNIMGQQVTSVKGQGNMVVDMSGMPMGTYMVMLQDAQGNTLRREKVVKL